MLSYTKLYIIFCTILIILQLGQSQEISKFDNYQLLRLIPQTKSDLKILQQIQSSSDNYIFLNGVNFINENIDVVVAQHRIIKFKNLLKQYKILFSVLSVNFQAALGESIQPGSAFGYYAFYNLYSIYGKLDLLQQQHPTLVKSTVIGKTINGIELRIIKLSNQANKPEVKKPGIFVEGGTHGSAWMSPATVVFMMEKLLTSTNNVIQSLIKNYDWYFMPILNPDGYHFTQQESIWNKNRALQNNYCEGVDLNRNWNLNWRNSTSRTTLKPCLENYPGLYPFSENETRLLSNFLNDLKNNNSLHLYLSFQTGDNKFLYPYGSPKQKPHNVADLEILAEEVVKALAVRRGTRYTYGSISNSKYPIYGTSIDWVYRFLNIPLSFRWELPSGEARYRIANQIIPVAEETFDSVVELITKAQSLGYFAKI